MCVNTYKVFKGEKTIRKITGFDRKNYWLCCMKIRVGYIEENIRRDLILIYALLFKP